MEREITQLPDRRTGDINNIRDRKIAKATEAASSSDITSQCKLLLENGQTGEFMKVLKGYIDESVRAALGALVSNLDKGSSISKVLATDANNDLGSITPANLASVLSDEPFMAKNLSFNLAGGKSLPISCDGRTRFILNGQGQSNALVIHAIVSGYGSGANRNPVSLLKLGDYIKFAVSTTEQKFYIKNEGTTTLYISLLLLGDDVIMENVINNSDVPSSAYYYTI